MPLTDTDRLSTPNDMAELLKRLTAIVRDVETLSDNAQQRFWDDVNGSLQEIPAEELRLNDVVSMRSVNVLYSILSTICGPQLAEMVNGATKEYYESLISQMKEVTHRAWDAFLEPKLDAAKDTGVTVVSVSLASNNNLAGGIIRRVEGTAKLLKLTDPRPDSKTEHYFSSKDIIVMEIVRSSPPEA